MQTLFPRPFSLCKKASPLLAIPRTQMTMKPDSDTEPEEDFWDLGDEEEVPLVPASRTEESADAEPEEESGEENKKETKESTDADPEEEAQDKDEIESADEDIVLDDLGEDPELEDESAEEESDDSEEESVDLLNSSESVKGYFSGALAQTSMVEKASLLAVLILFIGAASWGISTFYDNAPEGDLVVFDEKFPVEGTYAAVAEIETYWRKPIRSGENADHGVQLKAAMIPCARIVLDGSGTAALAVSFRNSEQELIGDPVSLEVNDGKFVKTGTPEIIITSTAGFENLTEINAYTNFDIDPWSLLIVEGAAGTNPSYTEADKKLAEVRISAESRE